MDIQEVSHVLPIQPRRTQSGDLKPSLSLPVKEPRQPSAQEVKTVLDKINHNFQKNDVSLDFSIDETTSIHVIKVTNTTTGDIVMQFPSKVVLAISEAIANKQAGALVEDKA